MIRSAIALALAAIDTIEAPVLRQILLGNGVGSGLQMKRRLSATRQHELFAGARALELEAELVIAADCDLLDQKFDLLGFHAVDEHAVDRRLGLEFHHDAIAIALALTAIDTIEAPVLRQVLLGNGVGSGLQMKRRLSATRQHELFAGVCAFEFEAEFAVTANRDLLD